MADQHLKDVIGEAIRKRELMRGLDRAGRQRRATQSRASASMPRYAQVHDTLEHVDAETVTCAAPAVIGMGSRSAEALRAGRLEGATTSRQRACGAAAGAEGERARRRLSPRSSSAPAKTSRASACSPRRPRPTTRSSPTTVAAEQDRVLALFERRKAVACRDRTAALIAIADPGHQRAIETEKNRRGLLDYDDLIDKTRALLERVESAWVHYKLDSAASITC